MQLLRLQQRPLVPRLGGGGGAARTLHQLRVQRGHLVQRATIRSIQRIQPPVVRGRSGGGTAGAKLIVALRQVDPRDVTCVALLPLVRVRELHHLHNPARPLASVLDNKEDARADGQQLAAVHRVLPGVLVRAQRRPVRRLNRARAAPPAPRHSADGRRAQVTAARQLAQPCAQAGAVREDVHLAFVQRRARRDGAELRHVGIATALPQLLQQPHHHRPRLRVLDSRRARAVRCAPYFQHRGPGSSTGTR